MVMLCPVAANADEVLRTAVSGETVTDGVAVSDDSVWENAITTSTLNLGSNTSDVQSVLVVASFECTTVGSYATDAQYKIVNSADSNVSQTLQRGLAASKTNDYGIGSLVHIFDVSSLSGNLTYTLQHLSTDNRRLVTTTGTIVAIPLSTTAGTPEHLDNACASVTGSDQMQVSTWEDVPSSTVTGVTLSVAGHLYVAASIESGQTGPNSTNTGEWKIMYRQGAGDWTDLGYSMTRSTGTSTDSGLVSLVAVKLNQDAADYSFKLQHRQTVQGHVSAYSLTNNFEVVAVALADSNQYFTAFEGYTASPSGITSSDITANSATTANITPYVATPIFVHAQYNMTSNDSSAVNTAKYDLCVDQSTPAGPVELDSREQDRYITDDADSGSGASVGLSSSLSAATEYTASLRHASDGTNTLVTSNAYIVGFTLGYATAQPPVPEWPTMALVSIGILAIILYYCAKNRRLIKTVAD